MEGFNLGSIVAHIRADTTQFNAALEEAKIKSGAFQDVLGGLAGVLKTAAVGLGIAAGATAAFGAVSLKAYTEAEETGAQLNQVLMTTGKNAQISAKGVDDIAFSMEKYSGKTRDSIEQGQIILLQFKQVTAQTLPEFTKAMLDVSQRMGVDSVMAAKTLGIALDDPTTGMSRLRRSGIDFTDSQKEAIKALQKSGDIAGADALLMKSLEERVGGAAGAYRNTLGGSIASARASLKDFEITVGGTIANYLEPLAKSAANALSKIDWQKVVNTTINTLKGWDVELDKAWQKLDTIYQTIEHYLEPKLEALKNSFLNMLPTLRTFMNQYIIPLAKTFGTVGGEGLVGALGLVIDALNLLMRIATPVIEYLDKHKTVVYDLAAAFVFLKTVMILDSAFSKIQVAFITFQTITVPSMMATLSTLGAAFIAAIPVAAILAAFVVITNAFLDTMNTLRQTRDAVKNDITAINSAISQDKALLLSSDPAVRDRAAKALAAAQADLPHKAAGGPVSAGKAYMVGEHGPEVIVPNQSGTVVPNNKLGASITTNLYGTINIASEVDANNFLKRLTNNQELVMKGITPVK